jgi:hypothetical protein
MFSIVLPHRSQLFHAKIAKGRQDRQEAEPISAAAPFPKRPICLLFQKALSSSPALSLCVPLRFFAVLA